MSAVVCHFYSIFFSNFVLSSVCTRIAFSSLFALSKSVKWTSSVYIHTLRSTYTYMYEHVESHAIDTVDNVSSIECIEFHFVLNQFIR